MFQLILLYKKVQTLKTPTGEVNESSSDIYVQRNHTFPGEKVPIIPFQLFDDALLNALILP